MKFWHFNFEGYFSEDAVENSGMGLFSSCLVQADNYFDAESDFLRALESRKINLIAITEHFPVDTDPSEMDPENEKNLFWFEWCEEVELAGKPTFEALHIYPKEEVVIPATN